MDKITKHLPHYLPLVGILLAGVFGFWAFSYNQFLQIAVVISAAISYISWGIIHHLLHGDLYLEVVIEYFLIAALATSAVIFVIF